MELEPIFAEAMLDEVQELLEEMLELAQRSIENDCTDEERDDLQRQLVTLRERIDGTVDAYDRMGDYREALYAAWKASNDIVNSMRS
ncbi:MAG: hypothetical protein IJV43_01510 [Oscillospiraceae bacterium]|nr:hypothetical protein [Oscillospiraceae bacterium]